MDIFFSRKKLNTSCTCFISETKNALKEIVYKKMAAKTKTETTVAKTTKGKKASVAKGKAAKGEKKAKSPKTPKKSNIPAIKRPRALTQDTFGEYMASVVANLEYRTGELEALHEAGKCPHKAIQHLKSVMKEYTYLTKRITPVIKPRRKQVDKKNNILMKKVSVSDKLAKFLHLSKGEQVSRSECNTAVTMYINVKDVKNVSADKQKWLKRMNPGGDRCLQSPDDGSVIIPDKALSDLLDYPAYQKRVAAGKHYWHRRNKETKEKVDVLETDDRLTYSVVQHLIAPHFSGSKAATAAAAAAPTKGKKGKAVVEAVEEKAESEASSSSSSSESEESE